LLAALESSLLLQPSRPNKYSTQTGDALTGAFTAK
jgi:hypothetical protein